MLEKYDPDPAVFAPEILPTCFSLTTFQTVISRFFGGGQIVYNDWLADVSQENPILKSLKPLGIEGWGEKRKIVKTKKEKKKKVSK